MTRPLFQNMDDYSPSPLLRNGHTNTLFTYVFRKNKKPVYERERMSTPDGDFIDVDYLRLNSNQSTIAILLHGLEGSSSSQYIEGIALTLFRSGINIAALNHRSCSGEINKTSTMYHSGFTKDLDLLVNHLDSIYDQIILIGYSMGGSIIINYFGKHNDITNKIKAACCISVPLDLESTSRKITKGLNKIYENNFLSTLKIKALRKQQQFPKILDYSKIKSIKTLVQFDDIVTSTLHGFEDAIDYYKKVSAKQFLSSITMPTLLINAYDDPFLAPPSFPNKEFDQIFKIYTKYGGHVGFYKNQTTSYIDVKIKDFLLFLGLV